MPAPPRYPGIYLTETQGPPPAVTPTSTGVAAFVGAFSRGPVDAAVLVDSWGAFTSRFGELDALATLAAYGVHQFFRNGGSSAWIVRVTPAPGDPPVAAATALGGLTVTAAEPGPWGNELGVAFTDAGVVTVTLRGATVETVSAPDSPGWSALAAHVTASSRYVAAVAGADGPVVAAGAQALRGGVDGTEARCAQARVGGLLVRAANPGAWGAQLSVEMETSPSGRLDLVVLDGAGRTGERHADLDGADAAALADAVNHASSLVALTAQDPSLPVAAWPATPLLGGSAGRWGDGAFTAAVTAELSGPEPRLARIAPSLFDVLCVPELALMPAAEQAASFTVAHAFCREHRALLLLDPPAPEVVADHTALLAWAEPFLGSSSAALYYPWVQIADPADPSQPRLVPPSGSIAGVYAATDVARGVWHAPAGVTAGLAGVTGLAEALDDEANGELNVSGINALRTFPTYGTIVWGARTLAGADLDASSFKYVPVRRLTDHLEQSLVQSLRWAVFEPNDQHLWASLATLTSSFMSGLFAAGAFAGATAAQAFTVACDSTTTSPQDVLDGVVHLTVGFAPVAPAEFVILDIVLRTASATAVSASPP